MKRTISVIAATAAILTVLAGPAVAEKVSRDDPRGDATSTGYDISTLTIDHRPDRVRIDLEQEPYFGETSQIRIDVPGRAGWDYMVTWFTYQRRLVTVQTRRQVLGLTGGTKCEVRSARFYPERDTLRLTFPRSCVGEPKTLRGRADSNDTEGRPSDSTRWTPWAERA